MTSAIPSGIIENGQCTLLLKNTPVSIKAEIVTTQQLFQKTIPTNMVSLDFHDVKTNQTVSLLVHQTDLKKMLEDSKLFTDKELAQSSTELWKIVANSTSKTTPLTIKSESVKKFKHTSSPLPSPQFNREKFNKFLSEESSRSISTEFDLAGPSASPPQSPAPSTLSTSDPFSPLPFSPPNSSPVLSPSPSSLSLSNDEEISPPQEIQEDVIEIPEEELDELYDELSEKGVLELVKEISSKQENLTSIADALFEPQVQGEKNWGDYIDDIHERILMKSSLNEEEIVKDSVSDTDLARQILVLLCHPGKQEHKGGSSSGTKAYRLAELLEKCYKPYSIVTMLSMLGDPELSRELVHNEEFKNRIVQICDLLMDTFDKAGLRKPEPVSPEENWVVSYVQKKLQE